MEKWDESTSRRDEQRRRYSKMDKWERDTLARSPSCRFVPLFQSTPSYLAPYILVSWSGGLIGCSKPHPTKPPENLQEYVVVNMKVWIGKVGRNDNWVT
jgi:hypothetical protein